MITFYGNIKSLQRKGMTNPLADPLRHRRTSWTTSPTPTKTRVGSGRDLTLRQRINDAGVKTVMAGVEHFVDGNTSNTDYLYDNSGNLKQDLNKGISSIVYNHLNKPTTITFSNGKKIQYIYDAAGSKLRQKVFGNGGSATTVETDYVGPFHYEDSDGDGSGATTAILFFAHEEGRVRRAGEDLIYETFLKDHLGNVRVMFADMNGDGAVSPDPVNGEVLQVDHFYPFGLRMAGLSLVPAVKNSYLFTGKETQDELGLGWIDFGARMYDAAAGRWNGVDGMAEKYMAWSPYNYVMGSLLMFIDPNGMFAVYNWEKSRYENENGEEVSWNQVQEELASETAYDENTEVGIFSEDGFFIQKDKSILRGSVIGGGALQASSFDFHRAGANWQVAGVTGLKLTFEEKTRVGPALVTKRKQEIVFDLTVGMPMKLSSGLTLTQEFAAQKSKMAANLAAFELGWHTSKYPDFWFGAGARDRVLRRFKDQMKWEMGQLHENPLPWSTTPDYEPIPNAMVLVGAITNPVAFKYKKPAIYKGNYGDWIQEIIR